MSNSMQNQETIYKEDITVNLNAVKYIKGKNYSNMDVMKTKYPDVRIRFSKTTNICTIQLTSTDRDVLDSAVETFSEFVNKGLHIHQSRTEYKREKQMRDKIKKERLAKQKIINNFKKFKEEQELVEKIAKGEITASESPHHNEMLKRNMFYGLPIDGEED